MWEVVALCVVAVAAFWLGKFRALYQMQNNFKRSGLAEDFSALVKRYHERKAA
jgi:hypothetical protein